MNDSARQHDGSGATPHPKDIKRWRQYLADERAEGAVYRELAQSKTGEESKIFSGLADAEQRHEQYWKDRLGDNVGLPKKASLRTRFLATMAKQFGSVFTLALLQSAESRNDYLKDDDVPESVKADEAIHAEVIRALAEKGRLKMSGAFRAAVFGANDGLVSNMALVMGMIGAAGSENPQLILVTGVAGLLAGALSMAAGEYVSVSSQKELLDASTPDPEAEFAVQKLDMDTNELALVYRARGMSQEAAERKASDVINDYQALLNNDQQAFAREEQEDTVGSPWQAAFFSFICFAVGAVIPILPFIFGMTGVSAMVVSAVLVGLALFTTGAIVGLLSGTAPVKRGLRQMAIGFGAAGITYVLGLIFDVSAG